MKNKEKNKLKEMKINLNELVNIFNERSLNISFEIKELKNGTYKLDKYSPDGDKIETIKGDYKYIKHIILNTPFIVADTPEIKGKA